MANISAIKLPDGVTYDLVDRVSTIDVATTSADGLMSSSDKTKLNGIESGAEKNVITAIYGSDDLHAYIMPYIRFTKANGGYEYATTYVGVNNLIDARGFITTETDPTVPSWAKQSTKPSYTAAEVGAVPTTRTVNGQALSSNITLDGEDINIGGGSPYNVKEGFALAVDAIGEKQDELVSGTNIKTINGNSILGSGDLTVTGGTQVKLVRW